MLGRLFPVVLFACLLFALPATGRLVAQSVSAQEQTNPAQAAAQTSQYEQAVAYYQKLLSAPGGLKPRSAEVEARTRLATAYFMLHRYGESLQAVQPLTSQKSAGSGRTVVDVPAQAWVVQGLDYLQLNRPSEAIPSLRRALALNNKSGTARLALGDALARSNRMEDAGREYHKQTQLTPEVAEAWYKLGLIYSELATRLVQNSGKQGSVVGQQLVAEELLARGNSLDAARALLPLVRRYPNQPQVHADLGKALLDVGYAKPAEAQFRQELALDPECPLARFGLAEVAALDGKWDQVFPELERLAGSSARELRRYFESPPPGTLHQAWTEGKIKVPTGFSSTEMGIAWQAWLTGAGSTPMSVNGSPPAVNCQVTRSKAAGLPGMWLSEECYQTLSKQLREKKTLSLPVRIKLAEAEFRLGQYQEARHEAERVLAAKRQSDWGRYWLSKAEAALADDCFVKVGLLNPDSARVHQMLAEHYASWSDYSRATSEFLAAIRLAPELPDLHLGLGSVYWRRGEWPQAEAELKKTLELTPGSALAHYELGDTYIQQQQWQAALEQLRKVPDDSPVALQARLDRAQAEAEQGQTRTALDDLLPALPQDKDGEIHYRVAGLYRKLGDSAKAAEALAEFKRLRASSSLPTNDGGLDFLENDPGTAHAANSPHR